jgi:hypothetical protein
MTSTLDGGEPEATDLHSDPSPTEVRMPRFDSEVVCDA